MNTSFISWRRNLAFLGVLVILLGFNQPVRSRDLNQLLPGLYPGGITLGVNPDLPPSQFHTAHFTPTAESALGDLNRQLSRSFAAFPFNASGSSFAFNFDRDLGTLVNTEETLGPIFAERASTLGRGKWSVSFYGTFFEYDSFNGRDLDNLTVPALHTPVENLPPGVDRSWEFDTISIRANVDATVKIFSPTVTYGVTDRLDVSALLPIVNVDMNVNSFYTLNVSPGNLSPNIHDTNVMHGATPPAARARGSATGIGDLVVGAKYRVYENGPVDLAGAFLGQFATGDEDDFLGTGDNMLRPFLVASRTFRQIGGSPLNLTPHLNLGYRFNVNHFDRSSFDWAGGFEFGIRRVSLAWDMIGSHYNDGFDRLDTAVGVRWNFWKTLVLSGNLMFPVNDEGVRSDLITTVGIGATF